MHEIRISAVSFRSRNFVQYFPLSFKWGSKLQCSGAAYYGSCVSTLADVIMSYVAFFRPMAPLSRCMSGVETGSACGHLPYRSDRSFYPSQNFPGTRCLKHKQTSTIVAAASIVSATEAKFCVFIPCFIYEERETYLYRVYRYVFFDANFSTNFSVSHSPNHFLRLRLGLHRR